METKPISAPIKFPPMAPLFGKTRTWPANLLTISGENAGGGGPAKMENGFQKMKENFGTSERNRIAM